MQKRVGIQIGGGVQNPNKRGEGFRNPNLKGLEMDGGVLNQNRGGGGTEIKITVGG